MDVRQVSRRFGAFALVAAGLAVTVATAFEPAGDQDTVGVVLRKVAAHQSDQRVLIVADLVAVLMLPAMLYLMRLAKRGAPRLALAGGALAFAGWLAAFIAFGGLDIIVYQAARLGQGGQTATLVRAVTHDPAIGTLVAVFVLGHVVGMLLLGGALWRSRAVPGWAAAVVGLAPLVHVAVHSISRTLDAGGYGFMAIGLAGCAVVLWRTPDVEWDLPPLRSRRAVVAAAPVAEPAPAGG
jgi:hypothetical protein